MEVSVPIITRAHRKKSGTVRYVLHPVLFPRHRVEDSYLNRGMSRLVGMLQKGLREQAAESDHRRVLQLTAAPRLTVTREKVRLESRAGDHSLTVLVGTTKAFGRRIAVLLDRNQIWFEILRGDDLSERTREVLQADLKEAERSGTAAPGWLNQFPELGKFWISTVEFEIRAEPELKTSRQKFLAMLGAAEKMDGMSELEKVGRCLDRQFPDDLDRSAHRETEVESLGRLLNADDRRPLLVVGPPGVGKTALIHEATYRRVEARRRPYVVRDNIWLISPQRLISGMSYVGQWENRLLAILEFAQTRNVIVYFDDLIGLFEAGVTRDSDLSVADVLKPWLENRKVRFLAEITPAALRRLREIDRSFADLFHPLPLTQPDAADNLRIQFEVIRRIESRHGCRLELDVLPTVLDLAHRFSGERVFPGSAAGMLRTLAARNEGVSINRDRVLTDFQSVSGLSFEFLDATQTLEREEIETGIREMMIGQDEAVRSAADVLATARARLNDPSRPLGSFLFLGPTGVGKTQCARAICRYLFGDAERMIRFDMNEFLHPGAVSRLTGTRGNPEGLLTTAVRRQPFSLILLDEIEKAHPDVFDLLLQVLGEGRLTDALGRTADFTNCLIVLTSNLGAARVGSSLGFREGDETARAVYTAAAEKFFRPEFLNRLDHLIPFDPLTEEQVRTIAERNIAEVTSREGFLRRQTVLLPDRSVIDRVMRGGFDTRWGARGIRRMIEHDLLEPIAEELARQPGLQPDIVRLSEVNGSLTVDRHPIVEQERLIGRLGDTTFPTSGETLDAIREVISRHRETAAEFRPEGELVGGDIRPEQYQYLHLIDELRAAEEECDRLRERLNDDSVHRRLADRGGFASLSIRRGRSGRMNIQSQEFNSPPQHRLAKEMQAVGDIDEYVEDAVTGGDDKSIPDRFRSLIAKLAMLEQTLPDADGWHHERCLIWVQPVGKRLDPGDFHRVCNVYGDTDAPPDRYGEQNRSEYWEIRNLRREQEFRNLFPDPNATQPFLFLVEGMRVGRFFQAETGLHRMMLGNEERLYRQVRVDRLLPDDDLRDRIVETLDDLTRWESPDRPEDATDPFPLGQLVRSHDWEGSSWAFRDFSSGFEMTGWIAHRGEAPVLEPILIARSPVPAELRPIAEFSV